MCWSGWLGRDWLSDVASERFRAGAGEAKLLEEGDLRGALEIDASISGERRI